MTPISMNGGSDLFDQSMVTTLTTGGFQSAKQAWRRCARTDHCRILATQADGEDCAGNCHVGGMVDDGHVDYVAIGSFGELTGGDGAIKAGKSNILGACGGDAIGFAIQPAVGIGCKTDIERAGIGGRVGKRDADELHVKRAFEGKGVVGCQGAWHYIDLLEDTIHWGIKMGVRFEKV